MTAHEQTAITAAIAREFALVKAFIADKNGEVERALLIKQINGLEATVNRVYSVVVTGDNGKTPSLIARVDENSSRIKAMEKERHWSASNWFTIGLSIGIAIFSFWLNHK